MSFKDHFSTQAADYARFRPRYPDELFAFVGKTAPANELAWDCATGSGQAAVGLARSFQHVIATDASASQIKNAEAHSRVTYRVATAESSGLEAGSCDAITVAQALHWFEFDSFVREAKRVLKNDGVLVVSSYLFLHATPQIDAIVNRYYHDIVGPYWPPERVLVERGLREFSFPFEEIAAPELRITMDWTLADVVGYLQTWSATQRYLAANGSNPLSLIESDLRAAWGDPASRRPVSWPLEVRAFRK
jgi:SAM-dependent methyltransferase